MKFKHFLELAEEDTQLFSLNSWALSELLEIPETQAKYFMAKLEWESEKHGCCCDECMCGQDSDGDLPIEYQSQEQADAIQKYFDTSRLKQEVLNADKVKRNKGIDVIIDDRGILNQLKKGADYDVDYPKFEFKDLPMKRRTVGNSIKLDEVAKAQALLDLAIDDVLKSNRFSAKTKDKVANAQSAEEVRDILIKSEMNKARG